MKYLNGFSYFSDVVGFIYIFSKQIIDIIHGLAITVLQLEV